MPSAVGGHADSAVEDAPLELDVGCCWRRLVEEEEAPTLLEV